MFRLLAPGFRRALALPSLPMRALARGFAAGGPPAPASGGDLYSVVMKELQFEREDDSVDKQLAEMREALSAEWAVESSVGSALVTLSRKGVRLDLDITRVPIEGDEEPEFAEGAEDEDAPPEEGYRMLVSIDSGKGKTMRFACTISDALVVHQVQLYDTDKLPAVYDSLNNESAAHYIGPVFEELDTALQNAFYEFLASKGVNDDLCESLAKFCDAKEQTEYVKYLEEVAKFVKK